MWYSSMLYISEVLFFDQGEKALMSGEGTTIEFLAQ